MSPSSGLKRLLQFREMGEQNCRVELASVSSELHRLEASLEATRARERFGRALVRNSIGAGGFQDRYIGLEEISNGAVGSQILRDRIEQVRAGVARLKADLLEKHQERIQIERLIETRLERESAVSQRRLQFQLDEWAQLNWSGKGTSVPATLVRLRPK